MAQKPINPVKDTLAGDAQIYTCNLLNGDWSAPLTRAQLKDGTIMAKGTIGAGYSAKLYGTNDPADLALEPAAGSAGWTICKNAAAGTEVAFTALLQGHQVLDNYAYYSIKVIGGDGTTNMYFYMNRG